MKRLPLMPSATPATQGPSPRRQSAAIGSGLRALAVVAMLAGITGLTSCAEPADPPALDATAAQAIEADEPTAGLGPDPASDSLTAVELAERIRPLPTAKDLPAPEEGPIPVAISFPAIGVDRSPVDPVGVEANGEMEIPSAQRVGWYEYGARPGRPGSTVLAAHIASGGVDGVFRNLADVSAGDRFEVTMDDGSAVTYEIIELAQYNKAELPVDRVFARDGAPFITLVTCGGSFQPSLRSYQDNVVAYAAPLGN